MVAIPLFSIGGLYKILGSWNGDDSGKELTYEGKVQKLDEVLTCLDNSETPIDRLSENVKLGAKLIKELSQKLKQVEMEVRDAFKELEDESGKVE